MIEALKLDQFMIIGRVGLEHPTVQPGENEGQNFFQIASRGIEITVRHGPFLSCLQGGCKAKVADPEPAT